MDINRPKSFLLAKNGQTFDDKTKSQNFTSNHYKVDRILNLKFILMTEIIIYKTPISPYCDRAKQLLDKKNLGQFIKEIDITQDPKLHQEMLAKSGGRKTVPQIFINGRHIGGYDDLAAANEKGQLDQLSEA